MKLSSQEEYGLRCLLHLGRHPHSSLTILEISQAEGLSPPNVAKLLRLLRQGGFVESVRGQHGGYTLSRPSEHITVGEVLNVLGGRLYEPSFCDHFSGAEDTCQRSSIDCSVRAMWSRLQEAVDQVLGQTTLQDLLTSGQELLSQESGLLEISTPS